MSCRGWGYPCNQTRPLEWRLPWITICIQHRCLLVDTCPECKQIQRVAPYWFNRSMHPLPHKCRRRLTRSDSGKTRCTALLSATSVERCCQPHAAVLTAQQELCELLTRQTVEVGVYSAAPVTSDQLLTDVRILGGRILCAATPADLDRLLGGRSSDREIDCLNRRLPADWKIRRSCGPILPSSCIHAGGSCPTSWPSWTPIVSHIIYHRRIPPRGSRALGCRPQLLR